jgi:hypothetical protein
MAGIVQFFGKLLVGAAVGEALACAEPLPKMAPIMLPKMLMTFLQLLADNEYAAALLSENKFIQFHAPVKWRCFESR